MKTLYEIIKENAQDKGEEKMWQSVSLISNTLEEEMSDNAKHKLKRSIYSLMNERHYNECFAKEDVEKMYYITPDGVKRYAPYKTDRDVEILYESVKDKIPYYNMWDFYVAMNMVISDYCHLMEMWFPEESEETKEKKFVELTINFLNDEDNPFGHTKIWSYLNS